LRKGGPGLAKRGSSPVGHEHKGSGRLLRGRPLVTSRPARRGTTDPTKSGATLKEKKPFFLLPPPSKRAHKGNRRKPQKKGTVKMTTKPHIPLPWQFSYLPFLIDDSPWPQLRPLMVARRTKRGGCRKLPAASSSPSGKFILEKKRLLPSRGTPLFGIGRPGGDITFKKGSRLLRVNLRELFERGLPALVGRGTPRKEFSAECLEFRSGPVLYKDLSGALTTPFPVVSAKRGRWEN